MQTAGPYTHDPNVQNADAQDPNFQHQNQNQEQNQYLQTELLQTPYAQYPQANTPYPPNPQTNSREGDFTYNGQTYNIHHLHQLIDFRRPNSFPPANRGHDAFAFASHGAYGPHNTPPRPAPRLGPNGRPMIRMDHFGYSGEWVETPDPQAYRREDEAGRAERERDLAAQLEFIKRHPERLGNTWRPSWRRSGGW